MDQLQEKGGEEGGDATEDVPFAMRCRRVLQLLFLQSRGFITGVLPWFLLDQGMWC